MKLTRLLRARGRANVSPKRLKMSVLQADLQPVHGAGGGEQVCHLTRLLGEKYAQALELPAAPDGLVYTSVRTCTGQLVKFKLA